MAELRRKYFIYALCAVLFVVLLCSSCVHGGRQPEDEAGNPAEEVQGQIPDESDDPADVPDAAGTEDEQPAVQPVYLLDAFSPALPPLKDVYAGDFLIGAAVDPYKLVEGSAYYDAVARHYNVLTAEGSMKQSTINPADTGNYRFDGADKLLEFAEKQGAFVRGHTLIWHDCVKDFWFWHEDGTAVSCEELLARMEEYITAVAGHFKGRIAVWDVVNEPMSDIEGLRGEDEASLYASIIGDLDGDGNLWDYIEKAFAFAHAADPEAVLVINEYGLENNPRKLDAFCEMLEDLLQKGVPVGGVGIQLHAKLSVPYASEVGRCIERLAEFKAYNPDFTVQITEMDISVFESGDDRKKRELDTRVQEKLATRYRELFDVFAEQAGKGNLDMVVTWGVYDGASWLDSYPVSGRRDAPLLFDRAWKAKPAFWALADPEKLDGALKEYEMLHGQ